MTSILLRLPDSFDLLMLEHIREIGGEMGARGPTAADGVEAVFSEELRRAYVAALLAEIADRREWSDGAFAIRKLNRVAVH